mmetsp:Transcript_19202/g.48848  ORF Transcript_19202/g.48848 Transcript_19202/m.48848 type:complete len:228 (+) Transcript_19202:399-1082(+)
MPIANRPSRTYGGACTATCEPMNEPQAEPATRDAAISQSTLPRRACWASATHEGTTMAARLVPTTLVWGRPVTSAISGVTIVPPPIPSRPDANPATPPSTASTPSDPRSGLAPATLMSLALLLPLALPLSLTPALAVLGVAAGRAAVPSAAAAAACCCCCCSSLWWKMNALRGTRGATKYSQYPMSDLSFAQSNRCVARAPSGALSTAQPAMTAADVRSTQPDCQYT